MTRTGSHARRLGLGARAALLTVTVTGLCAGGAAAQEWKWPERGKNLQVLPEDFAPEKLKAVMTGFTRALGVRCTHCHVGKEGEPLTSYDFPSDANPRKDTARLMYRMLGTINGEYLSKVTPSGPERVNMWCHTCHRGAARPMKLEEDLHEVAVRAGVDAALRRHDELRERGYARGTYDFGEASLNQLGYRLLEAGRTSDAIAVFRRNVALFPESGNVHDSLAEAFLKAEDKDLARIHYERALLLDPDNKNAREKLRALAAGE